MSTTTAAPQVREISALFDMSGDLMHGATYGSGHIKDTYCAGFDQAGLTPVRNILQRISTNVFNSAECSQITDLIAMGDISTRVPTPRHGS